MRIITGKAKGIKLKTLEGDNTRPTAERVKEAVFSMLQFDIEGRAVLDLFAGSGQMALEALSRGASSATLVDRSREAIAIIRENVQKTRFSNECQIVMADYLDFLKRMAKAPFDIIFIDPPYAQGFYRPALKALIDNALLKPTSIIVCESADATPFEGDDELMSHFDVEKQSRYGNILITLFKPSVKEN